MSISIISKTQHGIQVYAMCTAVPNGSEVPEYQKLVQDQNVVFISPGSTNDLPIQGPCTGKKYVLLCIWNYDASSGKPISWVVFDVTDQNKIVDDDANPYLITKFTGNTKDGFQTIVKDNTFLNNYGWIIIVGLIILLLIFLLWLGIWLLKKRHSTSPQPVAITL